MRRFLFLLRDYKYDLISGIFAAILYFLTFLYSSNSRLILAWSLVITVVLFFVIIFLRTRDKNFYFIALDSKDDKDDWIGRGPFEYSRVSKSFIVPDTDPGNIYTKCLVWSDYKFEFDFKIVKYCIGVIFRAVNLSNYVMFQVREDGIRPHIRINGGWRAWEHKDVGLSFDKKLSLDKWHKCIIECDKDLIRIKILQDKIEILNRSWTIPHDRVAFPFPQKENDPNPTIIHFPVDLDYGSVGFRNANIEKALVKNVLIEKLSYGKA